METKQVLRPNFEKRGGLVTVVAQNAHTHEVLMVAYTDEAGWRKTLETGLGSYYSTSRKKSWVKGEESGNFQKVIGMRIDCDGDALIYLVEPKGPGVACHTNARSCFYRVIAGKGRNAPAPKAGKDEELPLVEVEVHENLLPYPIKQAKYFEHVERPADAAPGVRVVEWLKLAYNKDAPKGWEEVVVYRPLDQNAYVYRVKGGWDYRPLGEFMQRYHPVMEDERIAELDKIAERIYASTARIDLIIADRDGTQKQA